MGKPKIVEIDELLQSHDTEINNARGGQGSLDARLDGFDESLADNMKLVSNKTVQAVQYNGTTFIAHRGFSAIAPENTITAFDLAGYYGFKGIEFDVRITSDGEFVIMHDSTVDRTTNGTGNVNALTLAQIKALVIDSGNGIANYTNCTVPTLDETLAICRKWNMIPFVHINDESNWQGVLDKLKQYGLDTKAIVVVTLATAKAIREVNNIVTLSPDTTPSTVATDLAGLTNVIAGVDTQYTTQANIDAVHNAGYKVSTYIATEDLYNYETYKRRGMDYILVNKIISYN